MRAVGATRVAFPRMVRSWASRAHRGPSRLPRARAIAPAGGLLRSTVGDLSVGLAGSGSAGAVLLEPLEEPLPAVLRRLRAIARPVVGEEAVRRVRIDDDLRRLPRCLQRRPHLLDRLGRDALV